MPYREAAPAASLRALVSRVWAFPVNGHVHRVLPDGCMDIVVLDGRARVVGAMRRAIVEPASASAVLGIRMRPGEAARIFPAAYELTDSEALLAEVWHDEGRRFEDALLALVDHADESALDADRIIRRAAPIVERTLGARVSSHGRAVDLGVRAAAELLDRGVGVHETAARVGLSERQLARRFGERVGLSPRSFARVRRLQRAALALQRGVKLAEAAALAGYADQPHFTREANALAGTTPAALRRELNDGRDTSVPVAL